MSTSIQGTTAADDFTSNGCCPRCKQTCRVFTKFVLCPSIGLFLYLLDILTDVNAALDDYKTGDEVFAFVTIGLIFAPGTLFALYMFCEYLLLYIGEMACIKAPLWVLASPLLPVWVILRNVMQLLQGIGATLFPSKREKLIEKLNQPSRAYLVKFLEAFTESAPQLLVRLCKVALRSRKQFSDFRTSEIIQISVSLVTLSMQVVSTHQKTISTKEVIEGQAEINSKETLPWYLKIVAMMWWFCFLLSRFEALALFSASYEYWVLLVVGIHVLLIFLFQTMATRKDIVKRIFIYLFGAFVFIFSYVQFNLKTRMKVASWFPYTIFAIVLFVENSIMMTFWYFDQRGTLETFSMNASQPSSFDSANVTQTYDNPEDLLAYWRLLIFLHFGVFGLGLVFMMLLFIGSSVCLRDGGDANAKLSDGNTQEMQTMIQSQSA